MPNEYQIGDLVRLSANFENTSNSPSDPSSIFLRIVVGSADDQFTYPTTTAIVKDGVGSYHYDLAVNSPGHHYYFWRGFGDVQAAEFGDLLVHTPFSPFIGS